MEVRITSPLDMHLHVRDGEMMRLVTPLSAAYFAGTVVMPNLVPPVADVEAMKKYEGRVREAMGKQNFLPLMTLFFREYGKEELRRAKETPGFFGIKLYPTGVTTNSDAGVSDVLAAESTLRVMEELGIPLLVHGETHGFVLDREEEFLPAYRALAEKYPRLRVCMEHISTSASLKLLEEYENLCATITLHHLLLTLDDVVGGKLNPHLFCKPIAKREADREALLAAALGGSEKVMFGSDSAPHPQEAKECCGCAAGIFSAPVALPRLAQLFAQHGALEKLQAFVSDNARRIYGLKVPGKVVVLRDEVMAVPECYRGYGQKVVPMDAGENLGWSVVGREE